MTQLRVWYLVTGSYHCLVMSSQFALVQFFGGSFSDWASFFRIDRWSPQQFFHTRNSSLWLLQLADQDLNYSNGSWCNLRSCPQIRKCSRRHLPQLEMLSSRPAFLYPQIFPVISVQLLHCLYLYGECLIPPNDKTIFVTFNTDSD